MPEYYAWMRGRKGIKSMIKHICMFKMKEFAEGKSGYENNDEKLTIYRR